ncbi:MAG: ABC transporter substrate-binding protein [Clostridia bacterium]|nr:ABC transporter substrate-binding protein [Clostridia bacterium]
MKNMFRKLVAALLIMSMLLSGVSFAAADGDKTVNVGVTGTLATINPMLMDATEVVKYAVSLTFLPLVELNSKLEFVPMLAESITTEDNTTFTIKLREDAVWSDGQPVTAEDVEYTLVINSKPESGNIALLRYAIEGVSDEGMIESDATSISGVKVIDDKTLTITLKYPMALYTFESNFGRYLMTLPKHVLQSYDAAAVQSSEWFNSPDVISGPYFVTDYDLNHYVHFVANENYFMGAPKIKYLNFNILAASQLLSGLTSGEIDIIQQTMGDIPLEDYEAVQALDSVETVMGAPITNQMVFVNVNTVPDVRIRQALLCGIDRQTILEGLLNGNGEVVDGFLSSASPYFSEELGVTAYDPEKAAALIAEAAADGADTTITWHCNSGDSTMVQAVEFIAAMFAEMGLNIEIRTVNLDTLMSVASNGEHQVLSVQYTLPPVDPYTDIAWLLGGEGSWTNFGTDEINEALARSQTLTDPKEVAGEYLYINRVMQEQVPMLSAYIISGMGAVSKRLENARPDVFGTFVNVHEWDVK